MYLNGKDPRTPLAAPLHADLKGLPPTLVQVGTAETLLDDAIRIAEKMHAAGVDARLAIWPNQLHVFPLFAPILSRARRLHRDRHLHPQQDSAGGMPRMTGGDAIVDSLLRHGIDTIFGLPGVQMYGLFDAFARNANRLKVINARHEQTTAYMALGYAQSSGKPSAFTVVPGPGVMNTMGALTTWGVNAPVMCITGQVPSAMIGRGRGQLHEMPDQLATLKTLLKFAERIEHPTDAPQVAARAFQAMTSGRPRPVAVEMPWDMFPATADVTPIDPLGKRRTRARSRQDRGAGQACRTRPRRR